MLQPGCRARRDGALLFWASEGGNGVNGGAEITRDHDYSFIVNLLCDLEGEVLGGLCQQLCGSEQTVFGKHEGVSVFCFIIILHDKFALFIRVLT